MVWLLVDRGRRRVRVEEKIFGSENEEYEEYSCIHAMQARVPGKGACMSEHASAKYARDTMLLR